MSEVTEARNNAFPFPIYSLPWAVVFPILDNTGSLVSGAAGLDSQVSKNFDDFTACTNEATEIGSSGMYYLLLTGTEMNADVVSVLVQTSTTDAKTTPIALYPRKPAVVRVEAAVDGSANTIQLDAGASTLDGAYVGYGVINTGTNEIRVIQAYDGATQTATVTPNFVTPPSLGDVFILFLPEGVLIPTVNAIALAGAAQSATDLKDFADTGYDPSTHKVQGVVLADTLTTNNDKTGYAIGVGGIAATSFASSAIDAAAISTDAVAEIADGVLDEAVDGAVTLRQSARLQNSAAGAKLSGAATATVTVRDLADSKNRITATVDADGNRTAVSRDLT